MALRAGFSVTNVEHDRTAGFILAGFGGRGPSTTVREFPQIRVLALADTNSGLKIAIVSADYCFFDQVFHDTLRARLLEEGIHSVISCTHNHSAPSVYHVNPAFGIETSVAYVSRVGDKIRNAVLKAFQSLSPVATLDLHRGSMCSNLTMNRSIITDRAGSPWMHKRLFEDTPASVFTAVDRELVVLRVTTENGKSIIVVNFACHPVVTEREDNSCGRDFVGPMLRNIERGNPARHALFLNGALGDVNPAVWEFGPSAAARFGRLMAAEADGVFGLRTTSLIPALRFTDMMAEIPYVGRPNHAAAMSCLWIGDQPFITIPGELYSAPGLRIKGASEPWPVLIGLANGSLGYIPTAELLGDPVRYANDTGIATYHRVPLFVAGRHGNPVGIPADDMSDRIVAVAARLLAA